MRWQRLDGYQMAVQHHVEGTAARTAKCAETGHLDRCGAVKWWQGTHIRRSLRCLVAALQNDTRLGCQPDRCSLAWMNLFEFSRVAVLAMSCELVAGC